MRGGYQIIDLKGINFTPADGGHEIPGVYGLIEGTTKPIMISNFVVNGVEQRDFFAQMKLTGSTYQIITPIDNAKTINISDTDLITIAIG